VSIVNDLKLRGVEFDSPTERIDTGSSTGKLIFHIFASLAQFKRNLMRERTLAGLKAGRARGRKGGPPRQLTASDIKAIAALVKAGDLSQTEIAKRFGVSRTTMWRYARASFHVELAPEVAHKRGQCGSDRNDAPYKRQSAAPHLLRTSQSTLNVHSQERYSDGK